MATIQDDLKADINAVVAKVAVESNNVRNEAATKLKAVEVAAAQKISEASDAATKEANTLKAAIATEYSAKLVDLKTLGASLATQASKDISALEAKVDPAISWFKKIETEVKADVVKAEGEIKTEISKVGGSVAAEEKKLVAEAASGFTIFGIKIQFSKAPVKTLTPVETTVAVK